MNFVGGAAGATVGYIVGNIPGLVAGAKYGYDAGKTYQNNMQSGRYVRAPIRKRKTTATIASGPSYKRTRFTKKRKGKGTVGKPFSRKYGRKRTVRSNRKKVKKAKKTQISFKQRAQAQGLFRTTETFGNVSSPDSVYLLHSSGALVEQSLVIAGALLRTCLQKAGFSINNLFRELAVSSTGAGANFNEDSLGLRFVYTVINPITGDTLNITYEPVTNNNFGDILNGFVGLNEHLLHIIQGEDAGGTKLETEPFKLSLYMQDANGGTPNVRCIAEMFLEDISVELQVHSCMTVQNRTQAANAAAGINDTDRVDNQPLKGYLIDFGHSDPRVRMVSSVSELAALRNNNFANMLNTGVRLIRGAEFSPANEPLDAKYFSNSVKSTGITLAAGEMKKTSFVFKLSGKMTTVMKKLKVNSHNTLQIHNGQIGHCQMLSFEETMRTNSTNLVNVAYERELALGCIVKYKPSYTPLPPIIVFPAEYSNNL